MSRRRPRRWRPAPAPPSPACRSCSSSRPPRRPRRSRQRRSTTQSAVPPDEAATITRTLLLAQRTADATVAEAEQEASQIVEAAKAESRKAGEAERVRVEGEVQALLARRDFLESDVDQLEDFLAAQRERLTAVATALNDVSERVGDGLGPMRRPQLSASDNDHSGETAVPTEAATTGVDDDEPDVAALIEQVGSADSADDGATDNEGDGRHALFTADEPHYAATPWSTPARRSHPAPENGGHGPPGNVLRRTLRPSLRSRRRR